MKVVKKCTVLFILLVCFVALNSFAMTSLFDDIDKKLQSLPEDFSQTQNISKTQRNQYKKTLDLIKKKWESNSHYLDIVLDHDVTGSFADSFFVLCKHFDSYDYEGFCAQLSQTKEILKRLKQNESLSLGTLF